MMPESPATPLFVDPKSSRRAWLIRLAAAGGAVGLLALWGLLLLVFLPVPDVVPELLALAVPLVGFAAILVFVAARVRPLVVYTNGIGFPSSRRRGRRRKAFVPYSELEWIYADLSNPLVGIKVGLRGGEVRRIPLRILENPESVVAAIRSVVSTASEDLEMRALLRELDEVPGAYGRLWHHRSAVRWQVAFVGTAATVASVATVLLIAFVLHSEPIVWILLLVAAFVGVGLITWRADRRYGAGDRIALFTMVDTKTDVVLPLLDRFFASGRYDAVRHEQRSIVHGRRRYEMPSLGASLRVYHVPGSEYSAPHWAAAMRYPVSGQDRAKDFEETFARFAVSVGLREVDVKSVREDAVPRTPWKRLWRSP